MKYALVLVFLLNGLFESQGASRRFSSMVSTDVPTITITIPSDRVTSLTNTAILTPSNNVTDILTTDTPAVTRTDTSTISASIIPTSGCSYITKSPFPIGLNDSNVDLSYYPLDQRDICAIVKFCSTRQPGIYCYNVPSLTNNCQSQVMVECPFGIAYICKSGFVCEERNSRALAIDINRASCVPAYIQNNFCELPFRVPITTAYSLATTVISVSCTSTVTTVAPSSVSSMNSIITISNTITPTLFPIGSINTMITSIISTLPNTVQMTVASITSSLSSDLSSFSISYPERFSSFESQLSSILNNPSARSKWTILTTNLPPQFTRIKSEISSLASILTHSFISNSSLTIVTTPLTTVTASTSGGSVLTTVTVPSTTVIPVITISQTIPLGGLFTNLTSIINTELSSIISESNPFSTVIFSPTHTAIQT